MGTIDMILGWNENNKDKEKEKDDDKNENGNDDVPVVPNPTALRNFLIMDAFVVNNINNKDHDKEAAGGGGAAIVACLINVLCYSMS